MKKALRASLLSCLLALAIPAWAQSAPPVSSIPPGQLHYGPNYREQLRDTSPEQREQMREERRQRREAWQQLSPEERHQLRRDIRDAVTVTTPRRMLRGGWLIN